MPSIPRSPAAAPVLEAGDTQDPMELYVGFRGHAPSTAPLLAGRNL